MFGDWLTMGSYESRKIDRFEEGDLVISTARVNDSDYPIETAIRHPFYNEGSFIIVENYETEEEARKGHKEWVKQMTKGELPEELEDIGQSGIAQLCKAASEGKIIHKRKDLE